MYQSVTREVWPKGFVALVPSNIPLGAEIEFSLKIKREQGVSGKGKVLSSSKQPGNYKIVVSIEAMAQASVSMLETACLDAFLARI
jgi:hypothetical protein